MRRALLCVRTSAAGLCPCRRRVEGGRRISVEKILSAHVGPPVQNGKSWRRGLLEQPPIVPVCACADVRVRGRGRARTCACVDCALAL